MLFGKFGSRIGARREESVCQSKARRVAYAAPCAAIDDRSTEFKDSSHGSAAGTELPDAIAARGPKAAFGSFSAG